MSALHPLASDASDGMSNKPKRSRARIWWTVLALFVLYLLSIGPATCFSVTHLVPWQHTVYTVLYLPILSLSEQFPAVRHVVDAYNELWWRLFWKGR